MVALMMLGVWLLVSKRKVAGAVAVALAALAKPYAVLVLPAFWRPWDWRVPLAVAAAVLACYLPYLGAGWGVFGFLTGYISEEGLSTGSGIWLVALAQASLGNVPGLTASYAVVAAGIMTWLGLRVAFGAQRSPREPLADIVLLLTAGLFLMSPNYAWYFSRSCRSSRLPPRRLRPIWALTLGAFLLYRPTVPAAQRAHLEDARHAAVRPRRRVGMAQPAPERSRCDSPTARRSSAWSFPASTRKSRSPAWCAEVLAQGVDEVIVVDNGSTDATAARAAAAGARVVSEPRRGYGRACAAGSRRSARCRHRLLSRRRRQRRPGFPRRRGRPGRAR